MIGHIFLSSIHSIGKKSLFIVSNATVLQILDFGLARVLSNGIQTGYVSIRYIKQSCFIGENYRILL